MMRPTCFLLRPSEKGSLLYLGEVSTEECLHLFDSATRVTLSKFGATSVHGDWVAKADLPEIRTVSDLVGVLREQSHLSLVDLSVTVGQVELSTHDDGEAQLVFPDETDALQFLRDALDGSDAEIVIGFLLANRGRYVGRRGDGLLAFETFDAYLIDAHVTGS